MCTVLKGVRVTARGESTEGTPPTSISLGSLLPSHNMPPSFDIVLGRLVKKPDTGAGFVEWVTDHPNTSVTESLELWLEPNTSRRRLLTWLLWAERVAPKVLEELEEAEPGAELSSFADLMINLSTEDEEEIVQRATKGAGSKLSKHKGKRSLLTVIQEIIAKTSPKPLIQTPVAVSTLNKTRSWASVWDNIVKEILPSVDIVTDGSRDELEHPPGQPLSPADKAIQKDKDLVETLLSAMYPIGSEKEDEIHGFVSQM